MKRLLIGVLATLASFTAVSTLNEGSNTVTAWEPVGACKRWWPVAHDVGWRIAEWPTLNRIMYAESRCQAGAYNPEYHWGGHASGLMQIIWPTWRAECGRGNIFRPRFNLRCAKYIKRHYGWGMWATY